MVETVTTSRDRRATAGKRMTALLGKAQEDDELFWNHDTWDSIEEASEDGSYNIEDEMEVNRIDVFDSDFNDSEEDEDEEHDEEQDERPKKVTATKQLQPSSSSFGGGEIYNKIAQYFHPSVVDAARIQLRSLAAAAPPQPSSQNVLDTTVSTSTARALLIKKKSKEKQKKSIAGKEWNAGIVLHLPNSAQILENSLQKLKDMQHQLQQTQLQQQQTLEQNETAPINGATDLQSLPNLSNIPTAISKTATAVIPLEVRSKEPEVAVDTPIESGNRTVVDTAKTNKSLAAAAPRRNLRTKTLANTQSAVQSQAKRAEEQRTTVPPPEKVQKLDKKHVPTQEEMLIEAANVTEAENERWILARQRFAARGGDGSTTTTNKPSKKNNTVSTNRQVIQRFHSRRGCYNTITFPEMDLIPECWKKHMNQQQKHTQPPSKICIITGLPAKYRDPKTGYPYANLNAYKEIQRLYHHSTNNIEKSSSTISTNTETENKKQPGAKKRPALKSEVFKDGIAKDPLQCAIELPSMKKVKVDPDPITISNTRSVNLSVGAVTNNRNFSTDEVTSTTIVESSANPADVLMSCTTEHDPSPIIAVSSSAISSVKEVITAESNSKCTAKGKFNDVHQEKQQLEGWMKEEEINNNPEAATLENNCSAFAADEFLLTNLENVGSRTT